MMHLFAGSGGMTEQIGQIYALIRSNDGMTRQNLANRLDLPATTLNRALDRLLVAGLIRESGLADSSGGRRPSLYQCNTQAGLLLGVDLSETDARLVLTDLSLKILDSRQLPTWSTLFPDHLTDTLADLCRELAGQDHLTSGMVFGLGVCLADHSDMENASRVLPDLQTLADQLSLQACSVSSADTGLYAALWGGLSRSDAGGDFEPLLELTVGDTIQLGQARLVNPALMSLQTVDISCMIVPSPEKAAAKGMPLDQIAAIPAILAQFHKIKDDPALNWQDFCQAVQAGKRKARLIKREAAKSLAVAVFNALTATGCRHLMTGGDAFRDVPDLEIAFRDELLELTLPSGHPVHIVEPTFGLDIRAVGAAARALEFAVNAR